LPRHVVVLGICHEIQGLPKFGGVKIEDPDYAKLLKKVIGEEHLHFIFEEASGLGPSVACTIATELGLGYLDVDPDGNERGKLGIDVETTRSPVDRTSSDESMYWHVLEGQNRREQMWVERVNGTQFEMALLICGLAHIFSVSFRLRDAGFEVEAGFYEPRRRICDGLRKAGFA
jgi:hypothetical protein